MPTKHKQEAEAATTNWTFNGQQTNTATEQLQKPSNGSESISWSASEFVAHDKGLSWYFALFALATLFATAIFLITKDKVSVVIIAVLAILVAVVGARKPRTLQYQVGEGGIQIGQKNYPYSNFRAFSVFDGTVMCSLSLAPLKRFMPAIDIYFDPKDKEQIVTMVGSFLPIEPAKKDPIDDFFHRIRL